MKERRAGGAFPGTHPERRILRPERRAALLRPAAGGRTATAQAVVVPPVVNMFERPQAGAPVASQATLGTSVAVAALRGAWALVETPDRYRGWARREALLPFDGAPYPGKEGGVEVRSLLANIYDTPDVTAASPMSLAPLLARLQTIDKRKEWRRVRLPDGRRGWVQEGDVVADPAPPAPADLESIAATALRFLGLPYLWGGTTPLGLDCSGLAQLVFRLHGTLLPRDADLQIDDPRLDAVPREGIVTGDLLFFGPEARSITHVGLALDREAFVSATTYQSPVVRVDSLRDRYWSGLYKAARRLRRG